KPGSATRPFPGIVAEVVDKQGNPVPRNQGGLLVIKKPWPAMLRTIYGDDERYRQQYWSQIPHVYFTADGARQDQDGYFWIMRRVLRDIAGGKQTSQDTTTLEDYSVLAKLREEDEG